jgi:hypothetical protein
MDIKTEQTLGPAHMRYLAFDFDTYDEGEPVGFGHDEAAAIEDLLEKLEARHARH